MLCLHPVEGPGLLRINFQYCKPFSRVSWVQLGTKERLELTKVSQELREFQASKVKMDFKISVSC